MTRLAFPRRDDEWNTVAWEAVALALARKAGIAVAASRVETVANKRHTASLLLAMEVAGYFELDAGKARVVAAEVGTAVSKWREEAARHGLTKPELERMASAFDHRDLALALA